MPLTKKDLTQIKSVVHEEVAEATEGLARIVNKGFEHVEEQFTRVDKRFEGVDKRFEQADKRFTGIDQKLTHIDARLDTIEHDIAERRTDEVPKPKGPGSRRRSRLGTAAERTRAQ